MLRNISKYGIAAMLGVLVAGCQLNPSSSSYPDNEELRLLTPEQRSFLYANAERVERKEIVREQLKNGKGEVIGSSSSQTSVIYLKRSAGGGRFSVNTTCSGSCTGIPLNLCPSGSSSCGCNIVGTNSSCVCGTECAEDGNCNGTCKSSSVGFGNFGIFIAMDKTDPPKISVAGNNASANGDAYCE